jgi:signal transduction histidine kinase
VNRIRIATRLALIVVGGIVLTQLFVAVGYVIERRRGDDRLAFAPLLGQTAALVQLLDRTPAADRTLVLQAATSHRFLPRIQPDLPQPVEHSPILRLGERRLRTLIGDPQRFVALSLLADNRNGGRPLAKLRDIIGARVHAVVALKSGGYLVADSAENFAIRFLGVPFGLIASVLGFIVALLALFAIRRETKPLAELVGSVERFGADLEPKPVAERGAPDVRELIRAVNAMQARIVELVRNRTLVLGAIGHDLRTYLTRLKLRVELLPESEQRTKAAADLDGMQALVDDALAFARASFAKSSGETADLSIIVEKEVEARRAQGAPVTLAGTEGPLAVRGSPTALARVVANLTDNALAYGGSADLSLHTQSPFAELWIEDRGPGIPAAERKRVFEPFYRIEPSRSRDSGGAGLGLTIVRQIVEGLGGEVLIEDRPGGGARVRVKFQQPEQS